MDEEVLLACPECKGTKKLVVRSETSWGLNDHDWYCESVKPTDDNARCECWECNWKGTREDLLEVKQ